MGPPLRAAALAAVIASGGCTAVRQGTLERIPGGPTMAATVSISADSADVTVTNPTTREVLGGHLTLDADARKSEARSITGPVSGGGPGTVAGLAPPPGGTSRNTLTLAGELTGDQGTRLRCVLQVEKRLSLRGSGVCRAIDESGDTMYRLRF
ncbi:MAG: hypothetical protein ACM3O7_00230 [Acidobacteriota bacterium]